jgi:hypothetical protein
MAVKFAVGPGGAVIDQRDLVRRLFDVLLDHLMQAAWKRCGDLADVDGLRQFVLPG